jgi:hypothetical protein
MRYLILLVVFTSCQAMTQDVSEEQRKEIEFEKMMQNVDNQNKLTTQAQAAAAKKESAIVKNTVDKIVDLKKEVFNLKVELNVFKANSDSSIADTNNKFKLLPISNY